MEKRPVETGENVAEEERRVVNFFAGKFGVAEGEGWSDGLAGFDGAGDEVGSEELHCGVVYCDGL